MLKTEDTVNERMKEAGMINLLTEKFGALPEWATERLRSASGEDLHAWAKRVLHSGSLEETLQ